MRPSLNHSFNYMFKWLFHPKTNVMYRHGTITGFKVYRGLEKSGFQNHSNFSL